MQFWSSVAQAGGAWECCVAGVTGVGGRVKRYRSNRAVDEGKNEGAEVLRRESSDASRRTQLQSLALAASQRVMCGRNTPLQVSGQCCVAPGGATCDPAPFPGAACWGG